MGREQKEIISHRNITSKFTLIEIKKTGLSLYLLQICI